MVMPEISIQPTRKTPGVISRRAGLAVTLALGGDCLADIALLRAEPDVYGRAGRGARGGAGGGTR
jgi:hypothetical protein